MLIIQTAWSYMSWLPRIFSHIANPFQALTDSLLDSWLFPSANGEEPEAQAWPEYGSKLRYCGKSAVASEDAMSATSRSATGAHLSARALSSLATSAAAYRK